MIAFTYLCKKFLFKNDLFIAHMYVLKFCKEFELFYGEDRVTPNMHLHMYIKDCILDYGPIIYSFWLFSFEKCNGIICSLPTNKRNNDKSLSDKLLDDFVVKT